MIEFKEITKTYKIGDSQKLTAVDSANLKIESGELVALVGASGAGKSTVLKIIGLVERADKGEYLLDGENVAKCSDGKAAQLRANRIAFIMQDFALISQFTVYENVELPLLLNSEKLSASKRKKRVKSVLETVGISELADRKVSKLSGGQKQRAAIARALAANADIILADEPTGALDSVTGGEIIKLLKKVNEKGVTVIIVTHDKNIAEQCGRIIEISDGKILQNYA